VCERVEVKKVVDAVRARRVARVLISDIVEYAGEEVRLGLEKDDIFSRLAPDLDRARAYYAERVDSQLEQADGIFNHAIVDVLIFENRRVQTSIW